MTARTNCSSASRAGAASTRIWRRTCATSVAKRPVRGLPGPACAVPPLPGRPFSLYGCRTSSSTVPTCWWRPALSGGRQRQVVLPGSGIWRGCRTGEDIACGTHDVPAPHWHATGFLPSGQRLCDAVRRTEGGIEAMSERANIRDVAAKAGGGKDCQPRAQRPSLCQHGYQDARRRGDARAGFPGRALPRASCPARNRTRSR